MNCPHGQETTTRGVSRKCPECFRELEAELAAWTNVFGSTKGHPHTDENCRGAHPEDWWRDMQEDEARAEKAETSRDLSIKIASELTIERDGLKDRIAELESELKVYLAHVASCRDLPANRRPSEREV